MLVDDERELVDAVGALSVTRLRPLGRSGRRGADRAGRAGPAAVRRPDGAVGSRVPELAPATRDALADAAAAADLPAQPGRHRAPRRRSSARSSPPSRADPAVDLVAGYALDEPDAVDLVDRGRRRAPVPVVFGVGGIGPKPSGSARAGLLARPGSRSLTDPRGVAAATAALVADARARARHRHAVDDPQAAVSPSEAIHRVPAGRSTRTRPRSLLDAVGDLDHAAAGLREPCRGAPRARRARRARRGEDARRRRCCTRPRSAECISGVSDACRAATRHSTRSTPPGHAATWSRRWRRRASTSSSVRARDPVFGPVVLLGLGGTTAEALADVAVAAGAALAGRGRRDAGRAGRARPARRLARRAACSTGPCSAEVIVALGVRAAPHPDRAGDRDQPAARHRGRAGRPRRRRPHRAGCSAGGRRDGQPDRRAHRVPGPPRSPRATSPRGTGSGRALR